MRVHQECIELCNCVSPSSTRVSPSFLSEALRGIGTCFINEVTSRVGNTCEKRGTCERRKDYRLQLTQASESLLHFLKPSDSVGCRDSAGTRSTIGRMSAHESEAGITMSADVQWLMAMRRSPPCAACKPEEIRLQVAGAKTDGHSWYSKPTSPKTCTDN